MTNFELMDISGEWGESLFYKPIQDKVSQEDFDAFREKYNYYLKKYEENSDDRACAIIGALIIENEIDQLLSKWIEKYKRLQKNNDLTFSFKIEIALSLNLIPAKILNAIEPVRRIRNVFAHHLEISSFEGAEKKDPDLFVKMANKKNTLWKHDILDNLKEKDIKEIFQNLTMNIVFALNTYSKDMEKVKKYIREENNLNKILESQI